MKIKKSLRVLILNSVKQVLSICTFVFVGAQAQTVYAQTYNSQRDKPASNGNPDNPKMNSSLFPEDTSRMIDRNNPLIKKNKRGSTRVTSSDASKAKTQGEE